MANQLRTSGVFNLGSLGGGTGSPTRKWGGLVGRSLIASDALVKTGNLKLSELLQATYPVPGAVVGIKDRSGAVIQDRAGQAIQPRS